MVNKKYKRNCVESQSATHPIVQNVWRVSGEFADILSGFIVNAIDMGSDLRPKGEAVEENHYSRAVSIGM